MEKNTLHIALTNFPVRDEKKFINSIEKGCFERHKLKLLQNIRETELGYLYKPFKYYVFGNYDIAFISLINNYDFAQKLFIPKFTQEVTGDFHETPPYAYQIITGILNKGQHGQTEFHEELYQTYPFLGICNFKLNNGFLVGNGVRLTEAIAKVISITLNMVLKEKGSFIILHSFSWFEITILIFSQEPGLISEAISTLRSKKIKDLHNYEEIIKASSKFNHFHNLEDASSKISMLSKSDVFSDTQSYFCIQYDFFNASDSTSKYLPLQTEIEWQIKPGHFSAFKRAIDNKLNGIFKLSSISLITGKSDYVIGEKSASFANNYALQQILNKELATDNKPTGENKLIDHVRNIRTRVYLPSHDFNEEPAYNPEKELTSFRSKISYTINIEEYNHKLKRLKISKQCRANVLKMFYHYKNGIKDPVLSIYFFDFYFFILKVMEEIDNKCDFLTDYYSEPINNKSISLDLNYVEGDPNDVEEFEQKLAQNFNIFEEALSIRMLNSYRYEDISDINLDFNSSIQQLLSMYNTLAHVVGDIFQSTNNCFIVLINDRSTVANAKAINYSIYDLLTPEFIFYSLPKEILNYYHFTYNGRYQKDLLLLKDNLRTILQTVESESFSEYLKELFDIGVIDFTNLFVEQIRFYFSFNMDIDCYIYWTWSYAFKNSSAYNISGSFKENIFISELTRIIFTIKMFGYDSAQLCCPLPQLETYWHVHFPKINGELTRFFESNINYLGLLKEKVLENILNFVGKDIDKVEKSQPNDQSEILMQNLRYPTVTRESILVPLKNIAIAFKNIEASSFQIDSLYISKENLRLIMYRYLRFIYLRNKNESGYINFLYRDWEDCTPLKKYNDISSDEKISYYYRIDQTGGVFFPSMNKMEEYFDLRNTLLIKLWDFSMRETNEVIKKLSND